VNLRAARWTPARSHSTLDEGEELERTGSAQGGLRRIGAGGLQRDATHQSTAAERNGKQLIYFTRRDGAPSTLEWRDRQGGGTIASGEMT
jgi:hypothetical protein